MNAAHEKLILSFKRLIHVLSTGRKSPRNFGGVALHKAEVHILEIIGNRPGINVSDIAAMLNVTKGAISQIVSKLHAKKLIEKRIAGENMRINELRLTPQGEMVHKAHEEQEAALVAAVKRQLEHCDEKSILAFVAMVDHVTDFSE